MHLVVGISIIFHLISSPPLPMMFLSAFVASQSRSISHLTSRAGQGPLTETAQQTHIISLHTNTGRNQQTPRYSLWIELDTLPQGHVVLFISSDFGIVNDFVHALGVSKVILCRKVKRCVMSSGDIVGFGSHDGR